MIERVIGWILFLGMDTCLYGWFFAGGPDSFAASDTNFWIKLGTGLFLGAVAVIGILMGLGINLRPGLRANDTRPPDAT